MTVCSDIVGLLEAGQPQQAYQLLCRTYPDQVGQAEKISSLYYRARREYLKDESNRRPGYEVEIRRLLQTQMSGEDRERLEDIMESSLLDQHRCYVNKKPLLDSRQLEQDFKAISPVWDAFSQFQLPQQVKVVVKARAERRRVQRMLGHGGSKATSSQELGTIVAKCLDTISENIETVGDYYDSLCALGFLSGRRISELASTLDWAPVEGKPYQASVIGIAKKAVVNIRDGEAEHVIPLLCTYKAFNLAMQDVRNFRQIEGGCDDRDMLTVAGGARDATIKLFGRSIPHTQKRNIYSEFAYRQRETNQFHPGASKEAWIKLALCHELVFPDVTSAYRTMVFDD